MPTLQRILLLLLLNLLLQINAQSDPCFAHMDETLRAVFCNGPIIQAANKLQELRDSKDFVDAVLKEDPAHVLQAFRFVNTSDAGAVQRFLAENFDPPGTELTNCSLPDWKPSPSWIDKIKDPKLKNWSLEVHSLWKTLCRETKASIDYKRVTLTPVPNRFMIPGGRFREFSYWDSFWIIKGLLVSEMYETAALMLKNLAFYQTTYGIIPDGGRLYYMKRSQPPVLALAVDAYYNATKDIGLVKELLPILEMERKFWDENRSINVSNPKNPGKIDRVYRYTSGSRMPRPESYRADTTTTNGLNANESALLYENIVAAAESGWDFSTRWMSDVSSGLKSLRTTTIVPVDLNAFLCGQATIMARLYGEVGDRKKMAEYLQIAAQMVTTIEEMHWNEQLGSYFDYWLPVGNQTGHQNTQFFLSHVTPVFVQCTSSPDRIKRIFQYFQNSGAFKPQYGVPVSLTGSGQQWDFPNAWAPLVHMFIVSLQQSDDAELKVQAFHQAQKWLSTNFLVYTQTGFMYEKYRVDWVPVPGGGGEYDVQTGFGWTNGVALDLMKTYGDRLSSENWSKFANAKGLLVEVFLILTYAVLFAFGQ